MKNFSAVLLAFSLTVSFSSFAETCISNSVNPFANKDKNRLTVLELVTKAKNSKGVEVKSFGALINGCSEKKIMRQDFGSGILNLVATHEDWSNIEGACYYEGAIPGSYILRQMVCID